MRSWRIQNRLPISIRNDLEKNTFLPFVTPGASASTMKPVKALPAGALGSGSVRARTKYLNNIRKV